MRCGAPPHDVTVSPQAGGLVAAPCDDKRTRIFDLSGNKRVKMRNEDKQGHRAALNCAVWSADESVLFTGAWDGVVQAWGAVA